MAEQVSAVRSFGGTQYVFKHQSTSTTTPMTFGVYVPAHAAGEKLPALLYLSGLTCTHANVMEKGGAQHWAAKHKIIFIHPDTSPRGEGVADSERWDLGQGAGFYVDATQAPWSAHFKMRSYIEKELLDVVASVVPAFDKSRVGITGHSMGGHGALTIGLTRPDLFRSISALAPIAASTQCEWGRLALTTYLGDDKAAWKQFDASEVAAAYTGPRRNILVDQGEADGFLDQLKPAALKSSEALDIHVRLQSGYDHSYYFVATFLGDHFAHHAEQLK